MLISSYSGYIIWLPAYLASVHLGTSTPDIYVQKDLDTRTYILSHSIMSKSLQPCELSLTRLLCQWDSPGKIARVGCYFLLQEIFPTQESNPRLLHLLHCQADSLPLSHLESSTEGLGWCLFLS